MLLHCRRFQVRPTSVVTLALLRQAHYKYARGTTAHSEDRATRNGGDFAEEDLVLTTKVRV